MKILLTGGAGYVGSHTALVLLEAGFDVVVVDDLSNASRQSLERVEQLTGRECRLHVLDIRETDALTDILHAEAVAAVIHFAGAKAVAESVAKPLAYYDNNIGGTVSLCQAMDRANVRQLVFSSSATVYGDAETMPITEETPVGTPTNPYGYSKLMIEQILRDLGAADDRWAIALLRYFNPVGAHESGAIGEDPAGLPNNLMPFITQVAVGRREALEIFGDDYPTPDGTGVRDYIHVMDLAAGHLAALRHIDGQSGVSTWNLGTGRGYSVREVVDAFERVTGQSVETRTVARRPGDISECWADVSRARAELDWQASRNLDDIVRDAWRWQRDNPQGYGERG